MEGKFDVPCILRQTLLWHVNDKYEQLNCEDIHVIFRNVRKFKYILDLAIDCWDGYRKKKEKQLFVYAEMLSKSLAPSHVQLALQRSAREKE